MISSYYLDPLNGDIPVFQPYHVRGLVVEPFLPLHFQRLRMPPVSYGFGRQISCRSLNVSCLFTSHRPHTCWWLSRTHLPLSFTSRISISFHLCSDGSLAELVCVTLHLLHPICSFLDALTGYAFTAHVVFYLVYFSITFTKLRISKLQKAVERILLYPKLVT